MWRHGINVFFVWQVSANERYNESYLSPVNRNNRKPTGRDQQGSDDPDNPCKFIDVLRFVHASLAPEVTARTAASDYHT